MGVLENKHILYSNNWKLNLQDHKEGNFQILIISKQEYYNYEIYRSIGPQWQS